MDYKSFDLPKLTFKTEEIAYDFHGKSLILANASSLANLNLETQTITSQPNWIQSPPASSQSTQNGNKDASSSKPNTLRLVSTYQDAKVLLSPSGLFAISQGSSESLLTTNVGFNSGVHYWEIICPRNCHNLSIGIIKEGWNTEHTDLNTPLMQTHSFNTTTPRAIGIKLDLQKREVRYWLNGTAQVHKTIKNIQCTTWYPCVKMKEYGTHIIFNPYAAEPSSESPIYVSFIP